MSSTYKQLGRQIGAMVDAKSAAYGDSFGKSSDYLRLLYPNGVKPSQFDAMLLLVRDFDKSMRIATDEDAFGESPFQDKAGYAMLGARMHEMRKNGCGSANGLSAVVESKEQSGSAGQSAPKPITTSDAGSSEKSSPQPLSEQPSASSNAMAAPVAEAANPVSVAGLVGRVLSRNREGGCGICTEPLNSITGWAIYRQGVMMRFCGDACGEDFLANQERLMWAAR